MFETDPTLNFRQALASALLLVLINIVFRGKFINVLILFQRVKFIFKNEKNLKIH